MTNAIQRAEQSRIKLLPSAVNVHTEERIIQNRVI